MTHLYSKNHKLLTVNLLSLFALVNNSAKIKKPISPKIKLKSYTNDSNSYVSSVGWTTINLEKVLGFLGENNHFSQEFSIYLTKMKMEP